jgi:hypothetical protein
LNPYNFKKYESKLQSKQDVIQVRKEQQPFISTKATVPKFEFRLHIGYAKSIKFQALSCIVDIACPHVLNPIDDGIKTPE